MAYQKGDLRYDRVGYDTREDDYDYNQIAFYLPHSCESWVIGTPEQARQLIADLEELLKTTEDK